MGIKKSIIFCFLFQQFFSFSQNQIKDNIQLEEVIVSVTKIKDSLSNIPFSVSIKKTSKFQKSAQQFNLSEYIEDVPGLFISNDNNYAQDARISIRGFGSRANFGIRGIKLIVDGIPETTPDGQTQIDNLNLELIKNIEIIRGAGSSLYGNSSAGVIKIQTLNEITNNFYKIGYSFGSNQKSKKQFFIGLKNNQISYTVYFGQTKSEGFRDFSGFKNNNFNLSLFNKVNSSTKYGLSFNYVNSPFAMDAGGLTLEEVEKDREQARARNIDYDTQESINHLKVKGNFEKRFNKKITFSNYLFYSNRKFEGKIPVRNGGAIDLNRNYWGVGASLMFKNKQTTQIGFDIGNQKDKRKRFINDQGIIGENILDQKEKFLNYGIYIINSFDINFFTINSGIRYDKNKVSLDDNYLADGNSSDKIIINSTNPSLGINFKPNKFFRLFTNISSSFETPTLNEFGSSPIGTGFNKVLKSQKSKSFEFGFSTKLNSNLKFDLVYFNTSTKDEVLPYEDSNFPNQTFYNNAGATKRNGLEFSSNYRLNDFFKFNTSISIGEYLFDDFKINGNDYSENKIPGIPDRIKIFEISYINKSNLLIKLRLKNVGKIFANNSNSVLIDNFNLLNLKISKDINYKKIILNPFLIVNNILGSHYYDNIRINAFGGRFYEPGPKSTIFGGVKINL